MNNSNIIDRIHRNEFTLIAEIGVNYYDVAAKLGISLMEAAKFMILSAKNAGIHAVKFQTYKAETLASRYSPSYWNTEEEPTRSQYELFKKFDAFGEKEYRGLSTYCERINIEFCSTPFDFESADYLYDLMHVYKISSSDISNLPFIEYIAKKNKPIILSVGASNLDEIKEAVSVIQANNKKELVLMHCVLEYHTIYSHANLLKIKSLQSEFPELFIGYSDHTKPDKSFDVIKTAYLLGATVVEKHFTLDKLLKGNDHYHAMDENDAQNILKAIDFVRLLEGSGELQCLTSEFPARANARRSIVAAMDIPKGVQLMREMLTFKRPGNGISPKDIDKIIGHKANINIVKDTIIVEDMIRLDLEFREDKSDV